MSTAVRAGRAFVEMYVDNSALYTGLKASEDQLRQWAQNVGLATTAVGAGILGSLIPAVNEASKQAETLNAFRQVFAGANAEAGKLAQTLANDVGRSVGSIREGMTPIGAMVTGLGLATKEAARFSEQATRAALDISSFYNTSTEETFGRLRSALSGSSEAVDQFGINLRQQALELKLAEMGYAGSVQSASELEKTLARLAIIQDSLVRQNAAGDAVRTSQEYANASRTTADALRNLLKVAGDAVLPLATLVLNGMNPLIQAAADWLQQAPAVVQGIAGLGAAALVGGAGLAVLASKTVHFAAEAAIAGVGIYRLTKYLIESGIAARVTAASYTALAVAGRGLSAALSIVPAKGLLVKAILVATGAVTWGVVAAFAALVAIAASIGAWFYFVHQKTGALQPLFDALAAVGSRIAAVWQQNVIPVFTKLGALLGGLFSQSSDLASGPLKSLAEGLGGMLVMAAEAAAGAIALVADAVGWVIDGINSLLGIEVAAGEPKRGANKEGAAGGQTPEQPGAETATGPSSDLQQFAERVKDEVRTSAEKFATDLSLLDQALKAQLIDQETYNRKRAQLEQERDEADERAFEQSPEGQQAAAIRDFAGQLQKSTQTPLEAFQEQMQKIQAAFQAGTITAEIAQRGMDAAQKSLQEAQQKIEDEARQAAEKARKEQLEGINRIAEQRMAVAKAQGGDGQQQAEIEALRRQVIDLAKGGFQAEHFDALVEYLGAIVDRSAELDKQVADQRSKADLITTSAQEAVFGLGTETIDERLLKEQELANAKAEQARSLLERIANNLDD